MLSDKQYEVLEKGITDADPKYFKGILWGEFGTRKTTTSLRCRQPGTRAVLLHADRGWNVIYNHPDEFGDDEIIPIRYEGLSQVRAIVAACKESRGRFANVSLIQWDTVSQAQEEYIDFLMDHAKWSGNYREKASAMSSAHDKEFKDVIKGEKEVVEAPGMPDYHVVRNKFRPVVRELVRAPLDVMFICHIREPGPMENTLERRPNLTDKLWKDIARNATFIGFCEKDKGYTINFKPDRKTVAKSQILSLADKNILADDLPKHIQEWKEVR